MSLVLPKAVRMGRKRLVGLAGVGMQWSQPTNDIFFPISESLGIRDSNPNLIRVVLLSSAFYIKRSHSIAFDGGKRCVHCIEKSVDSSCLLISLLRVLRPREDKLLKENYQVTPQLAKFGKPEPRCSKSQTAAFPLCQCNYIPL